MTNLKTLAAVTGLNYQPKRMITYGTYQGYNVIFILKDRAKCKLNIGASTRDDIQTTQLNRFLSDLSERQKLITYATYEKHHISIGFSVKKFSAAANNELMESTLKSVITYCLTNGISPGCQACGENTGTSIYSTVDGYMALCPTCFEKMKAQMQEQQQAVAEKKSNTASGIVGALLGSLPGVAIWILAYQLNYIVGIAGFFMVVGSLLGYKKLSGKLNLTGCIIALVIAVSMLCFSEFFCLALEIYKAVGTEYDISFLDSFRVVPEFLTDTSILSAFFKDVLIGFVFMALGSFSFIRNIYLNANFKTEIIKID